MQIKQTLFVVAALALLVSTALALPPDNGKDHAKYLSAEIDNTTYIDANNILMFVTNHGNYGRDLSGFFGYDYGTFYPYVDTRLITSGFGALSPLYAAGLWLGGVNQNGDTLIAISEYQSEYVPGPMAGGSFQADRPEFRVYKLYRDSLETNPNADYLNWPVDQGAPVDLSGKPLMKGDQMLWTVFNDADPAARGGSDAGNTAPMGIEVQMTVWAYDSVGDFEYTFDRPIRSEHTGRSLAILGNVTAEVVEPENLTGHEYMVVFEEVAPENIVWHLIDLTTSDTVLFDQTNQSGDDNYAVVDGLLVKVTAPPSQLIAVEEVHNGSGVVDPPVNVMLSLNSTGDWYAAAASTYADLRLLDWSGNLGLDDWEMRFTSGGSNYYQGYAQNYTLQPDRAPFEVWNIGSDTPDNLSDDTRLFFLYTDRDNDDIWSWGDRLYFRIDEYYEPPPATVNWDLDNGVTIGWLTLDDSSHALTAPAEGTVIRFTTLKELTNLPSDTFTFRSPSVTSTLTGGEGNAVYIEYKLLNKGTNDFDDFFTAFWSDPDLGGSSDDFVGCDTLSSTYFCYNADSVDYLYGSPVPACGFRILAGPLTPSAGDSAIFSDEWVPDYRNLEMTSFFRFEHVEDPENYRETYQYMNGLLGWQSGDPYTYLGQDLKFTYSGDPVTGQGDLDWLANDRRMLAVSGSVTFNSGDSQYVLLKFAVGHDNNQLESLTKLREILGVPDIVLDAPDNPNTLPDKYSLSANYPNPFNPSTTIEYTLPRKSQVTLELFNVLGQKVRTLVDRTESPGKHAVIWDGTNESIETVASGIYLYRLRAEDFHQTRKMMLLK